MEVKPQANLLVLGLDGNLGRRFQPAGGAQSREKGAEDAPEPTAAQSAEERVTCTTDCLQVKELHSLHKAIQQAQAQLKTLPNLPWGLQPAPAHQLSHSGQKPLGNGEGQPRSPESDSGAHTTLIQAELQIHLKSCGEEQDDQQQKD